MAVRVWESLREEDMAQLRQYADITWYATRLALRASRSLFSDCILATIHVGPSQPSSPVEAVEMDGTTYFG